MEDTNSFILDEAHLFRKRPPKEVFDSWASILKLHEGESIRIKIVGYEPFIGLRNEIYRNGRPGLNFAVKISKKDFERELLLLLSRNEDWGLVMEDSTLQFEQRDR